MHYLIIYLKYYGFVFMLSASITWTGSAAKYSSSHTTNKAKKEEALW